MPRPRDVLLTIVFGLGALFFFTVINCTWISTIRVDTNRFEFAEGWECTRRVWSMYTFGLIGPAVE
jgi:hypothetical protein